MYQSTKYGLNQSVQIIGFDIYKKILTEIF